MSHLSELQSAAKKQKTDGEQDNSTTDSTSTPDYTLHGYWRSSASWRVRIALAHKNIPYTYKAVNLLQGEHKKDAYRNEINANGTVPALQLRDGKVITESIAIMEYIQEAHPTPSLYPADAYLRARTRQLAELINSGIHPIQNLKVLNKVQEIKDEQAKKDWAKYWIEQGLTSLEKEASKTAGKYLVGDEVTVADCCLVPQLYNARRWGVDVSQFTLLTRVEEALAALPAFKAAHADAQPDAQK